jgi:glutamine amidotransferase
MKTSYEIDYSAAIQKGNIYGFQFHPEKSHKYGMKLFSYLNGLR